MSKWYLKSKTFWFGVLYIAVGLAQMLGYGNYTPSPDVQQWLLIGTGLLVLILRHYTKKPIVYKRPLDDKLKSKLDK